MPIHLAKARALKAEKVNLSESATTERVEISTGLVMMDGMKKTISQFLPLVRPISQILVHLPSISLPLLKATVDDNSLPSTSTPTNLQPNKKNLEETSRSHIKKETS